MSEKWIKGCESALEKIQKISEEEEKDRLELVKSIKTSLAYMGRSLSGWSKWVNNPNTMANFSQEELEDIDRSMFQFAESFIEYDIEASRLGLEKGLKRKKAEERKAIRFII
jgi:hypothetical protein